MSEFVLEIFCEEIPALMQKNAAENFAKIAAENLSAFDSKKIITFVSPRRLSLLITNIADKQVIPAIKKFGPKIDAPSQAIQGFLKSVGLENESQLSKAENNGSVCYCYSRDSYQVDSQEIIQNTLPHILQKMTNVWPKLMRWNIDSDKQAKWIRPVRNLLCLFDDKIVKLEFFGLSANNASFDLQNQKFTLQNAANYQQALTEKSIIIDHKKRKEAIISQINKIESELKLTTADDKEKSALFDEINGLCENPNALVASIEEKFMQLPDEALILTLKQNQKYCCLKNKEGNLANKFIFFTNVLDVQKNSTKIISDNEKLVKARLSDVEFFIGEDLKNSLISRLEGLKNITFHQKLGSVYDKVKRLKELSKSLSLFVPHSDMSLIEKASDLCKADLITKAVAEMPELQGKIGSFYALSQKEDPKISAAIYEHYLPLGPNSELPKTSLGIVMAIADKIDSISGFFLADEKPTSSKDPYALRRSVLGIIRIGFQYNLAFPIRVLVEKSLNAYPLKLQKALLNEKSEKFLDAKNNLVEEIVRFFVERLKIYLKDNHMADVEIINAVIEEYLSDLDTHKYCDILYLANKIKFLSEFILDQKNQNIISLYKRSANILAIEEKKDGKKYDGKPSVLGFKTKYEKVLYRRIKQVFPKFKNFVIKGEFKLAFESLDVLELPLSQFFDHVTVNDEDSNIRNNRLLLLSMIRSLFGLVADLSKIEI